MSNQLTTLRMGEKFKKTAAGEIPVDWECYSLAEIANISGGGTPDRTNPEYWNGSIPWATPTDVTGMPGTIISKTKESISELGLKNSAADLMPAGSILMTSRATLGYAVINTVPMATNQGFANFSCKDTVYNFYLLYLLRSKTSELERLGAGSTFLEIPKSVLRKMNVPTPPIKEQKKIANILSAVDEAIEKTDAVIQKTKKLKKGLMQQLLTKGIGHKKFKKTPIGEIPVTWDIYDIKTLSKNMLNGGTPDTKVEKYWQGDIPWITGADFVNQKVNNSRRYITKEAVENSATNIAPKGSLLVVTRTGVGKLAIAPRDIAISQDITGIIPDTTKVLPQFMYWALNLCTPKLKSAHQGTSINGILREDLENFVLPVPTLEEQNKISKILSAVDEQIEKEEQGGKRFEQTKKALMNVLLTGKVRVREI